MKLIPVMLLLLISLSVPTLAEDKAQPDSQLPTLSVEEQEALSLKIMADYVYLTRISAKMRAMMSQPPSKLDRKKLKATQIDRAKALKKLQSYDQLTDLKVRHAVLHRSMVAYLAYVLRDAEYSAKEKALFSKAIDQSLTKIFTKAPSFRPMTQFGTLTPLLQSSFHELPKKFKDSARYAKIMSAFPHLTPPELSSIGASGSPSSFGHPTPDDGSGFQGDQKDENQKENKD